MHHVTLFRPESTPLVSIEQAGARLAGFGFGDRSIGLSDVVIRSLEADGNEAGLSVPLITAESLHLATDPAAIALAATRLERPVLHLRRGEDGAWRGHRALSVLEALPSVLGDSTASVELADGSLVLSDHARSEPVRLEVAGIAGSVTRAGSARERAEAVLRGHTETGSAALEAAWVPGRTPDGLRIEVTLARFDLPAVSAYIAPIVDRAVLSGDMDLALRVGIDDSTADLDADITVRDVRFEQRADEDVRHAFPLEVAIALLEDSDGRIVLELPEVRRTVDDPADAASALREALASHLGSLPAAPFEYLAGVAGRPGMDIGRLAFAPGSAELREPAAEKIATLNRVLALRPRLALTVFPALDEEADRRALARQQVLLHVNLASSAGLPGEPAPASLDFDDPIVRSVLDEFAMNRLPPARQQVLGERHAARSVAYYRAVFEALVDNETVSMPALIRLARYRARSVVEQLATADDDERIRQAEEIALAAPDGTTGAEVILEAAYAPASPTARFRPREKQRR